MNKAPQMTPAQQAAAARQNNASIRAWLLANCVPMFQPLPSIAVNPLQQSVINFPVATVGLIRGYLLKVAGTIHNGDANTITRTPLGASNVLSQLVFTDMNNQQRINTTGWHMSIVNSAKQPMVFGGAYTPNVPMGYGNNWTVMTAPATIANGADGVFQYYYWVPLSYSKLDLTGSMYANVINGAAGLQITINNAICATVGADSTLNMYSGAVAGANVVWKVGTVVTVSVWQDYLDGVPVQNGQPLLPPQDIRTSYNLINTALNNPVVNQQNGIPYAAFRTYLSTTVIFNNGGTLNTGSDVTNWQLNAANTTALINEGPNEAALMARTVFHADPPAGVYYFDHRDRPIQTLNFGNMQLNLTPSAVNANASLLIGWEFFADLSNLQYAQSLPSAA